MPLSDVLARVLEQAAAGQRPDPMAMEELRLAMTDLDHVRHIVGKWSDINGNIRNSALAGLPWLGSAQYSRMSNQSIPDDTLTPVSFTNGVAGLVVRVTAAEPTRLYFPNAYFDSPYKLYGVIGKVEWQANGAGRRAITLDAFDENDVQLYGYTMHSRLPTNILDDTIPFANGIIGVESARYMTVNVYQNSGGALNLQFLNFGIFRMST